MRGEASRRKPCSRAGEPHRKRATPRPQKQDAAGGRRPSCPIFHGPRMARRPKPKPGRRSRGAEARERHRAGDAGLGAGALVENVKRALQIEEVKLRGVPTGEYRYEGSVANRALELIGKELGLFVDRSESVNTHHVVSGEPITEAKWEERYARRPLRSSGGRNPARKRRSSIALSPRCSSAARAAAARRTGCSANGP